MKKQLASVILLSLLAACASEKPKETPAATKVDTPAVVPAASTAAEKAAPVSVAAVDPLNDPASLLSKRSVFYPFDVSTVQDADKPLVQAHAKYLREHPERNVKLEGNCDERGSNEYNLALGQRRADGVKKMLVMGGAKATQIKTASFGEEKPKATGHDEESWKQNRRTDIVY